MLEKYEYEKGTMAETLILTALTALAVALIVVIGATFSAWRRVRLGGIEQTQELVAAEANAENLAKGNLPAQDNGSLVSFREGMKMVVGVDGRRQLTPTRTISRDIY
ncbi:hypothetical protein [Novosphingobium sp. KACC 22771]|uniref:hypothetical protein n=1 Tax=Novosphingobium sp. KACC 22771 TaxID=3025670 RepID=UPI002365E8B3|nr:hypothetical protein [Novosphingobium sp. KACC 22771]WDF72301.1 hypothetical protein PQ467_16160 [Novosphingobium sp. KACC 22771]